MFRLSSSTGPVLVSLSFPFSSLIVVKYDADLLKGPNTGVEGECDGDGVKSGASGVLLPAPGWNNGL